MWFISHLLFPLETDNNSSPYLSTSNWSHTFYTIFLKYQFDHDTSLLRMLQWHLNILPNTAKAPLSNTWCDPNLNSQFYSHAPVFLQPFRPVQSTYPISPPTAWRLSTARFFLMPSPTKYILPPHFSPLSYSLPSHRFSPPVRPSESLTWTFSFQVGVNDAPPGRAVALCLHFCLGVKSGDRWEGISAPWGFSSSKFLIWAQIDPVIWAPVPH